MENTCYLYVNKFTRKESNSAFSFPNSVQEILVNTFNID